jgi:hypothetical protein
LWRDDGYGLERFAITAIESGFDLRRGLGGVNGNSVSAFENVWVFRLDVWVGLQWENDCLRGTVRHLSVRWENRFGLATLLLDLKSGFQSFNPGMVTRWAALGLIFHGRDSWFHSMAQPPPINLLVLSIYHPPRWFHTSHSCL